MKGLTYNGVPVKQLSTGESLRLCAAIAIHQNPKLRVMLVRTGSDLDSEGFQTLCEVAKENDCQLWAELVKDEAGDVGIHIEDGEIVSVDGEAVQEATGKPRLAAVSMEGDPVTNESGNDSAAPPSVVSL